MAVVVVDPSVRISPLKRGMGFPGLQEGAVY
jgi:hypothetical protein